MSGRVPAHRVRLRRPWGAAGLVLLGMFLSSVGADALPRGWSAPSQSKVIASRATQPLRAVLPVARGSVPVRLHIPSIGVQTALQALSLLPDGSLEVPSQWQVAGWFRGGVRPGDPGPAVIAGHVDSRAGPAVFYRLRELRAGAAVLVTRADGSVVPFVVDDIAQYPKDTFPAARVYGPQPVPVLRLITCTGDFNWATHSYLDNLVVSAHVA
ncbi:MAG: class F sortase [Actinomycetota bacterium]|nr:class F sortase [Actinomycetota bacterium]